MRRLTVVVACVLVSCTSGARDLTIPQTTPSATPRAISALRPIKHLPRRFAVRPDGPRGCGLIALAGYDDDGGVSGIWTVRPDGDALTRVVDGGTIFAPQWSPDARHIGFVQNSRSGRVQWLHVIEADGSHRRRIAPMPDGSWEWAPDGGRLVAASSSWGLTRAVLVINLAGRRRRVALGQDPAWSPDGSRIVYSTGRIGRGGGALYVVDPRTKAVRQVTFPVEASDASPEWSPDGRTIVFLRYPAHQRGQDGPFAELWSLDMATLETTRITDRQNDYNGIAGPTWSPNGDLIAYQWDADDYGETVVSRPDGSGDERIPTHAFYSRYPEWSPDGRSLVFESYAGVRVASARTGRSRLLVKDDGVHWEHPDWAPC